MATPIIGNIVKYIHDDQTESPAIVQKAQSDENVNLFVMSEAVGSFSAKNCILGLNWNWI